MTKKIISILQDLFARKCFFSGSHIFLGELKTEKVRKKFIFFCPFHTTERGKPERKCFGCGTGQREEN